MIFLISVLALLLVAKVINTLAIMRDEQDGADETAPRGSRHEKMEAVIEYPVTRYKPAHTVPTEEVTAMHRARDRPLLRDYRKEYKEWKRSLEQYERIRGNFI